MCGQGSTTRRTDLTPLTTTRGSCLRSTGGSYGEWVARTGEDNSDLTYPGPAPSRRSIGDRLGYQPSLVSLVPEARYEVLQSY